MNQDSDFSIMTVSLEPYNLRPQIAKIWDLWCSTGHVAVQGGFEYSCWNHRIAWTGRIIQTNSCSVIWYRSWRPLGQNSALTSQNPGIASRSLESKWFPRDWGQRCFYEWGYRKCWAENGLGWLRQNTAGFIKTLTSPDCFFFSAISNLTVGRIRNQNLQN